MDLWLARLILTHLQLHHHRHHPSPQLQVWSLEYASFPFSTVVLFFGGLPLALLVLQFRAALSSVSFSKHVVRVVLLFGPLAPNLAASAVAHWDGSRTVPWPLVLRLFASTELCSTRPASPTWSSREPSDLSGLDQGNPHGLLQDVPWRP